MDNKYQETSVIEAQDKEDVPSIKTICWIVNDKNHSEQTASDKKESWSLEIIPI